MKFLIWVGMLLVLVVMAAIVFWSAKLIFLPGIINYEGLKNLLAGWVVGLWIIITVRLVIMK